MKGNPTIRKLGEGSDFHDSSLIDISISSSLDVISIVVSTPDLKGVEKLWLIKCIGVLRFEFELLGNGSCAQENDAPLEIYDIYSDQLSTEYQRWVNHLKKIGLKEQELRDVCHITFASSFVRGWGQREELEGINIVCRKVSVEPAPSIFQGSQFSRPRIEAG